MNNDDIRRAIQYLDDSTPDPKPLAYCDYCNQWADGGTACCNKYDGSVHYVPVREIGDKDEQS